MADTIEQIILDVQAMCPDVDPNLARLWVRDAGRRTMEARQWSWLHKRGLFVMPASASNVSTGATVTVVQGSDEIEFTTGIATTDMVGRQFRTSTSLPIYDIVGWVSTTKLKIFPEWGSAGASAQGFTIFQNRFILPTDCQEILSAISPTYNQQLWLSVPQETLDAYDPQRTRSTGSPSLLSPCDYSPVLAGGFSTSILAIGTGPKPVASGTYVGADDATFTIQVTTGGIGGTAVYKYKKDEGSFVTGQVSSPDGNALTDGLFLRWPSTSTFILDAVFTIRATTRYTPGAVRMEIYPYSTSELVIPYWYIARYPDLTDEGIVLPALLAARSDVIREKAMEQAATWPGTEDRPDPYNQINRRDYHAANWLFQVGQLARQDNALFQRNVLPPQRVSYAPWPFPGGRLSQDYDSWYLNTSNDLLF